MAGSPTTGRGGAFGRIADDPWVTWLLETARERLGTDVAYLADFAEETQQVRVVAGDVESLRIRAGTVVPLEGTFCTQVLSGLLPAVVTAAGRDPRTRELPATTGLGIGSYVGAPIRAADGRPLGMLCCLGRTDGLQLDAESARFVEFLADLVTERLGSLEERPSRPGPIADRASAHCLEPVFQPVVNLGTGQLVGYEALTRFAGADTAAVFAQAAVDGQGLAFERLALEAVLAAIESRPPGVPVSVNLSPEALLAPGTLELLTAPRDGVLGVEITEHRPVSDYPALLEVRETLRAAGVRVSVDDAGAGYASLRHVLRLRPDVVKIDAAIVSGVHTDPARQALVTALVTFAAEIGAAVVAEGVELAEERDLIAARGVRYGQGWLFGRPGPLPEPAG